jgi:hypothetical protein
MTQEEEESVASMFERAIDLATGVDDDAAFALINKMVQRRDRAFELAVWRMRSGDTVERALSVYILGLLCIDRTEGEPDFVIRMLERAKTEREAEVLQAMVVALRQAEDPRAIPLMTKFSTSDDAKFRRNVIQTLGVCIARSPTGEGMDVLIKATRDLDDDVRDWATYELGLVVRHDSVRIRDALFERLQDENEDCRRQALAGLARRRDMRALPLLEEQLKSDDVWTLDVQAAAALRSHRLLPLLQALKEWWDLDPDALEVAIEACDIKVEARNYVQYEKFRVVLQHDLGPMFPGINVSLACDLTVEGGPVVAISSDPNVDLSYPSIPWLLRRDGDDPEVAASHFAEEVILDARRR